MMKAQCNGIDIAYTVEGSGPWVTMSHSLASNSSMWDEQAALLAKHYRVLRFDTRGHGDSSAPPAPYTLDDMAEDLHALFFHLGISETHWIGLSMGGMIGETYALTYPGVFRSMILADTTSRRPPNAEQMWGDRVRMARAQGMDALVDGTLARWFTDPFRQAQPAVMTRIADGIRSTPVEGFAGCCDAIAKIDVLDRLKEIDCPALVIVGDQDHGTPPDMARQIHANLRGSELLIIPSAAHLSNIEQPAVFNRAMLEFLAKHG